VNAAKRLIGAINDVSPAAISANTAVAAQKPDADALAHLPTRYPFAEHIDSSDDFMAGNPWERDAGYSPIYGGGIGMTDSAGFDSETDSAGRRIDERAFNIFEFSGRRNLNGVISLTSWVHLGVD
jgi:hypothetical protein